MVITAAKAPVTNRDVAKPPSGRRGGKGENEKFANLKPTILPHFFFLEK